MNRTIRWTRHLLPLAFLGQLLPVTHALAEPAEGEAAANTGLEEIVVTATRRTERLQDVPISVLAFSQEKLDQQGLKNIDDLARLSPGVAFQRNGMSSAGNYNDEGSDINIRGVDSTAGTSTTGIYIDDTPIQTRHIGFGSINAFPALFDLDRVEVLRGPQGTLFGAGAEGGVVRFISPEPEATKQSGYGRLDYGITDGGSPSYEGGVAFGAPIIEDVLSFRASVSYRRDGGWVDRVDYSLVPNASVPNPTPVYNGVTTQTNANYWETTTARFALKWKVNDALEIMPSIYYQNLYINDTAAYWVTLSDPGSTTYRNGNAGRNPSHDPFTLTSIRIKWDVGFASLFSNTAFYDRNQNARSDYTQYLRATWASIPSFEPGTPPPQLFQLPNVFPHPGDNGYATFQDDQRNFYQEIRLASNDPNAFIVWSGGLFYSHLSENVPENIIDTTLNQQVINYTGGFDSVCFPAQPCPNGLIYVGPGDQVVDKQIALFGEVTFKFTDTLKATAGLRVSKVDYTGSVSEYGPFLGTTIVTSSSGNDKPITPKAVITWQPDRDDMVYASASKGFRPGGPNVGVGAICTPNLQALGVSQVPPQYSSDNLWSYELGAKNTFLDHKLEVDASIYYINWNNIQQNVYLPACGEQFTANLGKAKSEGGDITVQYRPITQWSFDFSAAYTDARLTKTSCAGTLAYNAAADACVLAGSPNARPIATNGDALLGAPWSFTGATEYHFAEWAGRSPYLRIDFQHQSAQKSLLQGQDSNNALYDPTLPGLPIINNLSARAGLRFSGVDLSVYGNNLTNAHPLEFESRDIAGPTDLLYYARGMRPRTVGVTATYRY
jgi:outer membrane receptor protein involved in Fe transport